MSDIKQDLNEQNDNIIPLRPKTAGDGPNKGNWLREVPTGAIFLCRPVAARTKDYAGNDDNIFQYKVLRHSEVCTLLVWTLCDDTGKVVHIKLWKDTERFSRNNDKVDIVRLNDKNVGEDNV